MLDKLKQQPLLGLTLAITAGFVLAHIATKALDITYEDALGSDPASAAAWLGMLAFASLLAWKRRLVLTSIRSIAFRFDKTTVSRIVFVLVAAGLAAANRGGRVYTEIAASGGSAYDARLGANKVAASVFVLVSLIFGIFFLALKAIRVAGRRHKNEAQ